MASTSMSIPVYLSIGGSSTEIGKIAISAGADGKFTLTTMDVAAALRETADAMEAAAREAEDTDAAS